MVDYIKYTAETANNWSRTWSETQKQKPWAIKRLSDSSTISQMQSKLWLIVELKKLNLYFKKVALIGGWYAQYITPLLIDNLNVEVIHNYDIDTDAQLISYKLIIDIFTIFRIIFKKTTINFIFLFFSPPTRHS